MKVGFFTFPRLVHGGGFERYIINFANYLATRGYRPTIVTSHPAEYRILSLALNLIYGNPILHKTERLSIEQVLALLHSSVQLLEVHLPVMPRILSTFDIIYTKNELLDLSILQLLKNLTNKSYPPIIVGVHTPVHYPITTSTLSKIHNILYFSSIYKKLMKLSSAVHVSNHLDYFLFSSHFSAISVPVFRIPYPFSVEPYPYAQKSDYSTFSILFAGRLTEQKGVDLLLGCIDSCFRDNALQDICWTIAGSGDHRYEKQLQLLARNTPKVRYLGHVSHEHIAKLYLQHDCVLLPSRWEVLPYVCLEAQAYGLPVIASNIPGPADIIIPDVTGFLVEPAVPAFVHAIRRVKDMWQYEQERYQELSAQARENIAKRFDPSVVFPQLESMLQEVASD